MSEADKTTDLKEARRAYATNYRKMHADKCKLSQQNSAKKTIAAGKYKCALCGKCYKNASNLHYHTTMSLAHRV